MRNKLLMLCVSVVAVAAFAALPAMAAAASPSLTDDSGAVVKAGTAIKAVSSGTTALLFTTSSGKLECATNTLEGEVTKNELNEVIGDISAASFVGTGGAMCKTSFPGSLTAEITPVNLPWCLTAKASPADTLTIDGGACGTTPRKAIEFTAHLYSNPSTGLVTSCTYERASVTATYNTITTPLVATVAASQTFNKTGGSILCPSTGTLSGAFTLTTGAGTSLMMD